MREGGWWRIRRSSSKTHDSSLGQRSLNPSDSCLKKPSEKLRAIRRGKQGQASMCTNSIMLSKFQKCQSAEKSCSLGANSSKTAKNERKTGKTHKSIIGLMFVELFILCLCKGMVLKHTGSLVSIWPSNSHLQQPLHRLYYCHFNINNKIRVLVEIHSIGDLKVLVRGDSNIPFASFCEVG